MAPAFRFGGRDFHIHYGAHEGQWCIFDVASGVYVWPPWEHKFKGEGQDACSLDAMMYRAIKPWMDGLIQIPMQSYINKLGLG